LTPHGVSHSNDEQSTTTTHRWSAIAKASLLIAGTTVGGGFLALPQTVVVPLGGFPVSALALLTVWVFLLAVSWILCQSIVQCHADTGRVGLGIVYLAQRTLGAGSVTLALLVMLTEATLVSQLSRAGILFANSGSSSLRSYKAGCAIAALSAAVVSFGGDCYNNNNDDDDKKKLATNFNAALTTIFLVAAVLLFAAGQSAADWSRCLQQTAATTTFTFLGSIAKATPTMLQLLVYGEILPNLCRMLHYNASSIRVALVIGSAIPLVLLTGWAALGVALLPPTTALLSAVTSTGGGGGVDPVTVLLQSGGAVQSRLYVLAVAAIGTTILGSYLALESVYQDVFSGSSMTAENRWWWLKQRPLLAKVLAIVVPPLAIACASPSIFFKAIDFAGAYPLLLLYGVISPLIYVRTNNNNSKETKSFVFARGLGLLSLAVVCTSLVKDVPKLLVWLVSMLR
jgi:tyrosine-specific transport protein